jgi:hypothetical protein
MYVLIFAIYFFLFSLALTRIPFFIKSNIKPVFILVLFTAHAATACIHNWIAYRYYPNHGDIWFFFNDSLLMKQDLLANPSKFISGIFSGNNNFDLTGIHTSRFVFQYEFMKYVNIIFNFFSLNNFYVNTLIFSFVSFFGNIALFRFFKSLYKNNVISALCTLLLPSTLFWTSVIHKDGLLYTATGFFCYYFFRLLSQQSLKNILLSLLFLAVAFLSRPNIFIPLMPAVIFWLAAKKIVILKPFTILASVIALTGIIFFADSILHAGLMENITIRQKEFRELTGNSRIYLPILEPTLTSFLSVLPIACINGFFQPIPGFGGQAHYIFFSIELIIIWLLVANTAYLIFSKKNSSFSRFDCAIVFFSVAGMIIIGFTIPFAGAIIRYRSIYLPFLIAPCLNVLVHSAANPVQKMNQWLSNTGMIKANL